MQRGGKLRECLRPSYGRPKLTLISNTAELSNFSFHQFHSHYFAKLLRILAIFQDTRRSQGLWKIAKIQSHWAKWLWN